MRRRARIKLRVGTRGLARPRGVGTDASSVIEAVDLRKAERFWGQVSAARSWRDRLSASRFREIALSEADVDAAFDGLE